MVQNVAQLKLRHIQCRKVEMRKSLCYNWNDYKTNAEVLNELKIAPGIDKINIHKSNSLRECCVIDFYEY